MLKLISALALAIRVLVALASFPVMAPAACGDKSVSAVWSYASRRSFPATIPADVLWCALQSRLKWYSFIRVAVDVLVLLSRRPRGPLLRWETTPHPGPRADWSLKWVGGQDRLLLR